MTKTLLTEDDVTETSLHTFATEASDLGIRAGEQLPQFIATTLGNKRPLQLEKIDSRVAVYHQELGCVTVKIFND